MLAGRYRVVDRLGRGGMGVVWRAVDEVLGREVAVKELRTFTDAAAPELAALRLRMQREARAAARIRHRGVVAVHDVAEIDGRPLIVMELVDGRSLDDVLSERGTLDPREVAGIGAQVMDALAAAHRVGVLHRDVKPGNILLETSGRVVLTDFGIATMEDPGDGSATNLTRSGELVGSLDYLAPERAQGNAPGPASDIWALGATLYAAVEGTSPFRRTSTWSTLTAIVAEPLPEPRKAGALGPVLRQLMAKGPEDRPAAETARSLLEAVASATSTPPGDATSTPPGGAPSTPPSGVPGTPTSGAPALPPSGATDTPTTGLRLSGRAGVNVPEAAESEATEPETTPPPVNAPPPPRPGRAGGPPASGAAGLAPLASEAADQASPSARAAQPTPPASGAVQPALSATGGAEQTSSPSGAAQSTRPAIDAAQPVPPASGVAGQALRVSGVAEQTSSASGATHSAPPASGVPQPASPPSGAPQPASPPSETAPQAPLGFGPPEPVTSGTPGFGPAGPLPAPGAEPGHLAGPTAFYVSVPASAQPRHKRHALLAAAAVTVVLAAAGVTLVLLGDEVESQANRRPSASDGSSAAEPSEGNGKAGEDPSAEPTRAGKGTAKTESPPTNRDSGAAPTPAQTSGSGTTGGGTSGGTSGGAGTAPTAGTGATGTTGGSGTGADATPAPVATPTPSPASACESKGDGKYNCSVWRTAKSYTASGAEAGVLNAGINYFYCQQNLGRRETYGQWTNVWWAKTDDDSGNAGVYVSDVYLKGGDNDSPVPGLPLC
ncbi:protein kinase [Streptomyces sp. ME02-8801-2C]|nr:protein kinase [Streptomyces sp. ME02-8801-2C]MDX3452428.1 protein kinase [Streptomyces sp. ME02-8801-2C]